MPARKLLTGLAHVFRWSNADGLLASNPTLTVDWPAGPQAYSLTLSRQFDVVTAISADRRTLTATWGGSGSPQMAISGDQPAPVVLQSIGLVGAALRVGHQPDVDQLLQHGAVDVAVGFAQAVRGGGRHQSLPRGGERHHAARALQPRR